MICFINLKKTQLYRIITEIYEYKNIFEYDAYNKDYFFLNLKINFFHLISLNINKNMNIKIL